MADTLSPVERSKRMARIRSRDTGPELVVRRMVHAMGYRYRLHRADLPGRPDLVFPGRKAVVYVHGCFWHRHPDPKCQLARLPKSKLGFWEPKLLLNRQRDETGFMIRRTEGLTIVTRGVTWTDADVRGIDENGISLCVLGGLLKLVEWPAIETLLVEELDA